MDIERLKALQIAKQVLILNKSAVEYDLVPSKDDQDFIDAVEIAVSLIDEAIARQSVKSEEVVEAIEYFEDTMQFVSGEPQEKDHRLAITALRQMRTEPCEYCDGKEKPLHCLRGEYGESVCVGVSKSGGYISVQKDGDNTLYAIERCPNCGRRLED